MQASAAASSSRLHPIDCSTCSLCVCVRFGLGVVVWLVCIWGGAGEGMACIYVDSRTNVKIDIYTDAHKGVHLI